MQKIVVVIFYLLLLHRVQHTRPAAGAKKSAPRTFYKNIISSFTMNMHNLVKTEGKERK